MTLYHWFAVKSTILVCLQHYTTREEDSPSINVLSNKRSLALVVINICRGLNLLITLNIPPVIQSIVLHRMVGLPDCGNFWEYVYSFWLTQIWRTPDRQTPHEGIGHAYSLAGLQLHGTDLMDIQWTRKQHNCLQMSGAINHVCHYNVYHSMLSSQEHPTVVVLWQYKLSRGMLWQNLSDILTSIKYSKRGKKRQHIKDILTKYLHNHCTLTA